MRSAKPALRPFTVGSWNIRTLQNTKNSLEQRTAILSQVLKTYKVDIAALSETRFADSGQLKEKDYTFFWSGLPEDKDRVAGVGFAIKRSIADNLEVLPEAINERLMILHLPLAKGKRMLIISAYAPTMTNQPEVKEAFYEDLRKTLKRASPRDSILLLGDFNARVGNDNQAWPGVIGEHLLGSMNSNGLLLLSLCREFNLVITNSIFQQQNMYKGTWCHPRSNHWHTLDYVITRQNEQNSVKITRAHRGSEAWSDHRLVRSKIKIRLPFKGRKVVRKMPKSIDCNRLKSPEITKKFVKEINTKLEKCTISEDTESSWKAFKETLYETSCEVLGFPKRKHQDWFDENDPETVKLIKSMHHAHMQLMQNKCCRKLKDNYMSNKRAVQNQLRQMKEEWWRRKAEELQNAADTHNTKAFYQGLKAVYGPSLSTSSPLLSSDGKTILTEDKQILERWVEHYSEVLNRNSNVNFDTIHALPQRKVLSNIDVPPSFTEVHDASRKLCKGKRSGKDGIPPEVFLSGGPYLIKKLTTLLVEIWKKGEVPQDFKDASIVSLFKKGKRSLCDNYRGISLLSVAGKILARVIINRINLHLTDLVCSESQCGFRKGRGTTDMVFCLRQLQEKSREHRKPLYMAFIDLTKAFDTVSRQALWIVLEKLGLPTQMRKIIRSFHDGMLAQIIHGGILSEAFHVDNGTKQGCVLAPLLFALYFAVMLEQALKGRCYGIPVSFRVSGGLFNIRRFTAKTKTTTELICDLLFADDCALVAQSSEELQQIIDSFSHACKDFGLTISTKKTEIVYQPVPKAAATQTPVLHVDGIALKTSQKFCYLGSTISEKATLDDEINLRISKASQAFGKLENRLWKPHDISLLTKIKVYRAVIIPSLTYGSETWTPYRNQIQTLDAFHLRKLRSICNISWKDKITNHEVLSRCQISGIEAFLQKQQLRWTGHTIRMENSRLPKILLYGQLANATRPEGRPLLRYKDKVKSNLSSLKIPLRDWEEAALDRSKWRGICSKHITNFEDTRKLKMVKDREERKGLSSPNQNDARFVCEVCQKVCKSNAGLSSHKRSAHPRPNQTTSSQTTPNADQRRTCQTCGKICKNERGLKIHSRVHGR